MMAEINLAKDIHCIERENNKRRQHAVTFSCLGKLNSTTNSDLCRWKGYFQNLLTEIQVGKDVLKRPLIIGLAESGIVPSSLMHQLLRERGVDAHWVCSTRRPSRGIHFTESHSHGPNHILPIPDHQPTELWFMEDEITTGRTVLHLALILCRFMKIQRVRFFAIADTRNSVHTAQFESILKDYGIHHSIHSLIRFDQAKKDEYQDWDAPLEKDLHENEITVSDESSPGDWYFYDQRPALQSLLNITIPFPYLLKGSLLVVGEAIDIGLRLVQMNPCLSFHHVTLSPWKIDDRSIFTRLDIMGKYHLYNYCNPLEFPLYVLNDPIDEEIGTEVHNLLSEKGLSVERLLLAS